MAKKVAAVNPTLSQVRLVLTAIPRLGVRNRKAVTEADLDFHSKRLAFTHRATPATWADTVAAARRLHREIKAAEATSTTRDR